MGKILPRGTPLPDDHPLNRGAIVFNVNRPRPAKTLSKAKEPEEQPEKPTHTGKPGLPSPLVSASKAWLAELDGDKVPDVDIRILLLRADNLGIALDDAPALEEKLIPYQRVVAVSPNGLGKYLLLPQGDWAGAGKQMAGDVVVIPAGEFEGPWVTSWDKIRDNEEFWLKQGAFVFSPLFDEAWELPFCFDGEDWADTHFDSAFGDTEWTLHMNAETCDFDLEERAPRLSQETSRAPGTWLEVECSGRSMSTGDIGKTISIDKEGGLWVYHWGYLNRYLGHASAAKDIVDVLSEADDECTTTAVVALSSDMLTPREMRQVLDYLAEADVNYPNCGLEDFAVSCVDFKGSAAELIQLTEDGPNPGIGNVTASMDTADDKDPNLPSRPVLIIVTKWPSGTMAFKFGSALKSALRLQEDEWTLVQMEPERIFRAVTDVSEPEFRAALDKYDVSCPGSVIFTEL